MISREQFLKSCAASQLFVKDIHGYKMGTPALKPYKQAIKSYQNDTILKEKATKNRTCNELETDVHKTGNNF